jgi:hypothetical protein
VRGKKKLAATKRRTRTTIKNWKTKKKKQKKNQKEERKRSGRQEGKRSSLTDFLFFWYLLLGS